MYKFLLAVVAVFAVFSCTDRGFTSEERALLPEGDTTSLLRVLTIDSKDDSIFLRKKAAELTRDDVKSEFFKRLRARMLVTVNDTICPGVGIAAPQVGVSRRLIAVQRFDKLGEPFEFYVNPTYNPLCDDRSWSREGCLSIPSGVDSVMRYDTVVVRYDDIQTGQSMVDTVSGFTAVIFQHEIEHLDGILFIDPH